MDAKIAKPKVEPYSLKDAPSLIERIWPAQKISVEAQKERKANLGQTLTGLGSYWKGRKPLILVRACLLASLLPATGDDEMDLAIFEMLCGMSDEQIADRFKTALTVDEIKQYATPAQRAGLLDEDDKAATLKRLPKDVRVDLISGVLARMPYAARVERLLRPEEVSEDTLTTTRMEAVNRHLGTKAKNIVELTEQLGVMRFGHRPCVGDTFCGGGSIPFEAARLGCDVIASDLNPIACMLTWGAFNIIGATPGRRAEIQQARSSIANEVDAEITKLGIEHDSEGNRAKSYLYCLETRCPQTGWLIPMSASWVISKLRNVVAVLVPDNAAKRFNIEIRSGVSAAEMENAALGTVQEGRLVYELNGETYSTPIKTIRGDRKGPNGETISNLRRWELSDFIPRTDDIFKERLYCVQWITRDTLQVARPDTYFASVTDADIEREQKVEAIVRDNLATWQKRGLVPDMRIEPGENTDQPIRERGWTHWHHLFNARQLLMFSLYFAHRTPEEYIFSAKTLDWNSRISNWMVHWEKTNNVFYNQALNTFYNYGIRCFESHEAGRSFGFSNVRLPKTDVTIETIDARLLKKNADIFITDPPYADAVNYHEITEFFIAWLRKNPPEEFKDWIWDSRRSLAIKGDGDEFRSNMVDSYKAMAAHMPENGLQIVMFTHQSASVWADMAQIFWGAGLQVMAAWYIATETNTELKKGGYVQGTVILVLRKRKTDESGYKDEIVQEVKAEVAAQIHTMVGLNQSIKGHGRAENLFEDADLQMAGYAAALRVLTRYERIDGTDMTKEALRKRRADEKSLVGEIIEFAVQVANEHMVPEYMPPEIWERLSGPERFYFKMMDIETTALRKLDNYQNFAKAFRVSDYGALMGSVEPNKASLKSAKQFKKSAFEMPEFGHSTTRAALYAIFELENDMEGDDVLAHLKDLLSNYHSKREELVAIADYIARKRAGVDDDESRAARILYGLVRNERLG